MLGYRQLQPQNDTHEEVKGNLKLVLENGQVHVEQGGITTEGVLNISSIDAGCHLPLSPRLIDHASCTFDASKTMEIRRPQSLRKR